MNNKDITELIAQSLEVGERIRTQFDELQAQTRIFAESLSNSLRQIDWEAFVRRNREATERLARCGWTVPMHISIPALMELADEQDERIDFELVEYYTENQFAELRRVRSDLLDRVTLEQWQELLKQSFEAFERGHHVITVPALCSVIEGVVATAGNALHRANSIGRTFLTDICAAEAKRAGDSSVHFLMWHSLELFVEQLFQKAPFDQDRPIHINRHWILHGRDAAHWSIADSLKLFNALQTIDSLLE